MAEEVANNPAEAVSTTPGPELASIVSTDNEPSSDEQPAGSDDPAGQAIEDELEEVEWDGKKGKVSKALKDGYLRQADYTRKTQEAAKEREAIEAERKTVAEQAQTFQRHTKEVAKFFSINEQIEPYEKIDAEGWRRFSEERPADASAAWIHYQKLKDQRDTLAHELNAQEQKWQLEAKRESDTRSEQGKKAIAAIPGWNQELDGKLKAHATTYGFTQEEWSGVSDPRAVRVLMDAYNWRQLQANQQRQASSQPVAAPPQVGGQRTPGTDLRALAKSEDISAYAKARNKQVNGARR